jgi:hypothetical protein
MLQELFIYFLPTKHTLKHAEERTTLLFCLFIVTQVPLADLAPRAVEPLAMESKDVSLVRFYAGGALMQRRLLMRSLRLMQCFISKALAFLALAPWLSQTHDSQQSKWSY